MFYSLSPYLLQQREIKSSLSQLEEEQRQSATEAAMMVAEMGDPDHQQMTAGKTRGWLGSNYISPIPGDTYCFTPFCLSICLDVTLLSEL
jgi:hypothetical protein